MAADIASLSRSFLPNNPKLAKIVEEVAKETYKARFLPKNLIRVLVTRAMEEVRQHGHEFAIEPEFKIKMEYHAKALHGRYRSQITLMNTRNKR